MSLQKIQPWLPLNWLGSELKKDDPSIPKLFLLEASSSAQMSLTTLFHLAAKVTLIISLPIGYVTETFKSFPPGNWVNHKVINYNKNIQAMNVIEDVKKTFLLGRMFFTFLSYSLPDLLYDHLIKGLIPASIILEECALSKNNDFLESCLNKNNGRNCDVILKHLTSIYLEGNPTVDYNDFHETIFDRVKYYCPEHPKLLDAFYDWSSALGKQDSLPAECLAIVLDARKHRDSDSKIVSIVEWLDKKELLEKFDCTKDISLFTLVNDNLDKEHRGKIEQLEGFKKLKTNISTDKQEGVFSPKEALEIIKKLDNFELQHLIKSNFHSPENLFKKLVSNMTVFAESIHSFDPKTLNILLELHDDKNSISDHLVEAYKKMFKTNDPKNKLKIDSLIQDLCSNKDLLMKKVAEKFFEDTIDDVEIINSCIKYEDGFHFGTLFNWIDAKRKELNKEPLIEWLATQRTSAKSLTMLEKIVVDGNHRDFITKKKEYQDLFSNKKFDEIEKDQFFSLKDRLTILTTVLDNSKLDNSKIREAFLNPEEKFTDCFLNIEKAISTLEQLSKTLGEDAFKTFLTEPLNKNLQKYSGGSSNIETNLLRVVLNSFLNSDNVKGSDEGNQFIAFLLPFFDDDMDQLAKAVLDKKSLWSSLSSWDSSYYPHKIPLDAKTSLTVELTQAIFNRQIKNQNHIDLDKLIFSVPDLKKGRQSTNWNNGYTLLKLEEVLPILYNKNPNSSCKFTTLFPLTIPRHSGLLSEFYWNSVSKLPDVEIVNLSRGFSEYLNPFLSNMSRICPNAKTLIMRDSQLTNDALKAVVDIESLVIELSSISKVDPETIPEEICNEQITIKDKVYDIHYPVLARLGLMDEWGTRVEDSNGDISWSMNREMIEKKPDEFLMWLDLAYTGQFPAKNLNVVKEWLKKHPYNTLFGNESFSDTSYTLENFKGDEVFPLHKVFLTRHEYFRSLFTHDDHIESIKASKETVKSAFKCIYTGENPHQNEVKELLESWVITV